MSRTDYGTTDVQVGSELYNLRFTLKAVKRIERALGGLGPAMQEVTKFNLTAVVIIIAAGAGLELKPKEVEALEEDVFRTGMITIVPALIDYLTALHNPAAKAEADAEKAAAQAQAEAEKLAGQGNEPALETAAM